MAREMGRLNALAVSRAKARGYQADGGGLYLQVSANGAKSWVFRYREAGKLREMGLGSTHTLTLAEARDAAMICRKQRLAGVDPILARHAVRSAARLDAAKAMTFRQCAEAYIEAHKAGWKNDKHAAQWPATLKTYAYPVFGDLPVQSVDLGLVMKVIDPLWRTKTETASRLRGRIEAVLDWARVRGYREGENPARWKGHLEHQLPDRGKVAKVEHHAALSYGQIGAFMAELLKQPGVSALALEFAILTAGRTGEVIGATWDEMDLDNAVWTIPSARMKAAREHRVPLSPAALAIVRKLRETHTGKFVFPGGKAGAGLSNMALLTLLRRMKRDDLTAHGFRSTFRDWAADTGKPRDIAEAALAHTVGDKVEAAYQRSDLLERRRKLMEQWAAFCATPPAGANVIPLHRSASA